MTDVAGTAPDGAGTVRGTAGRPSIAELIRATEVDLRLFGMVLALVVIWVGLGSGEPRDPPARQLPDVLGPGRLDGGPRHRHGPRDRVAQHRPVGRVGGRADRHGLCGVHGRHRPDDDRPRQSRRLDHRPRSRHRLRCPDRRVPGLPDRLRRHPVVRRDARRAARLPRPHLAVQWRHDGRPEPADVQPPRRRAGRLARWRLGLAPRRGHQRRRRPAPAQRPPAPSASTASRSGRCGPRQ